MTSNDLRTLGGNRKAMGLPEVSSQGRKRIFSTEQVHRDWGRAGETKGR